jgi:hypothetical protein
MVQFITDNLQKMHKSIQRIPMQVSLYISHKTTIFHKIICQSMSDFHSFFILTKAELNVVLLYYFNIILQTKYLRKCKLTQN